MSELPVPIIRAKLHPPPMAADTLRRERLLSLAQTAARAPLTLVSAPAGYGKSTLVSQWLESLEQKSAWLSLDAEDRDIRQFLSYVVAALRGPCPDCCPGIVELLHSQVMPDVKSLAASFCNETETLEEPVILVLDDFHKISPSEIDQFLDIVLNHPPRNLRLVIATRRNPALSLSAMRASGVVVDVRMQQLAFQEDETRTFIGETSGVNIPDDEIAIVHERTEGWPAALRLTVLALSESDARANIVARLPTGSRAIRQYLLGEVLARQPEAVRERLLQVAFLDRFCPELCDAVTPEGVTEITGMSFVNRVKQANLFSIALDESGNWYRFHHLFQSMVQEQALTDLGDEAVRDIHLRASTWYEEHEFLADAIRHALSANRPDAAADVIGRNRNVIMNHEWWHQLGIWLRQLPTEIVASRPELQLLKARLLRTSGEHAELVQALDAAESLLDTAEIEEALKSELYGSLASMRCYQFYAQFDGEAAARAARQAIALLPRDDLAERGYAMIILSTALQMTGDLRDARDTVYSEMAGELARGDGGATYMTRLLVALCFVHWMDADLKELDLVARNTEELCRGAELWEALSVALHFKAAINYHQNRLSVIDDDIGGLLRRKVIPNPEFYAQNIAILAVAQEALGDSDHALTTSDSLRSFAFSTQSPYLIELSAALGAELAMRQGRTAEALKWANEYDPEPLVPMYSFLQPPMCLAKILVLDGSETSCKRAQALLSKLEGHLRGIHNTRFLIETQALRALLCHKTGDTALAIEKLGQAVSLAQAGDFIRLFVDLGPEMAGLFNRLELTGEKLGYVGRILEAFRAEGGKAASAHADTVTGIAVRDIAGLPEQLSRREKEVLELLAGRLTNREIGEQLYISTNTVKRHARSIYEKLNVKGRREAVTKAVGLGLITS